MLSSVAGREEELHWLALKLIPGLGTRIAGKLIQRFRTPMAVFRASRTELESAGASGALFGLVGVLFVFGLKYRRELPEGFKRAFGTGMLPVILLNLGIGFVGRGFIDNAAHMGGLLSGAALAAVVSYKRPGQSAGLTIAWRIGQIVALLVVAISFFMMARNFDITM